MDLNPRIYGVMAEFDGPTELVAAARKTYEAGYRRIDGYSPFPIEELFEAIGDHKTQMSLVVLIGGVIGLISGYLMQYYLEVWDYPLNVGGRPYHSWPSFVPITFETTILCAALAGVFGMLALNGLPQPYHPVFNVPRFELASRDRFFLVIEARDPKFELENTRRFMVELEAREVSDIEA